MTNNEIFIIHGRNLKAKKFINSLLEALGLKPISFEEAKLKTGKGSPYNLEVLQSAITDKMKVVAIMTPDDIGFMNPFFLKPSDLENEKIPMGQSRFNVVFETGMAFATNPDETIIIVFGIVRGGSDLSGINFVQFEDTPEIRKHLKDLLKNIGCTIKESPEFSKIDTFQIDNQIVTNINKFRESTETEVKSHFSILKADIINSIKLLQNLCIKLVRNHLNEEESKIFEEELVKLYEYPNISTHLPRFLSRGTSSVDFRYYIRGVEKEYIKRTEMVTSEFNKTFEILEKIEF